MRVFITGFSGFLGKELINTLVENRDYKLRLLLNSTSISKNSIPDNIEIIWGELGSGEWHAKALKGIHTVIHCAWDSRLFPKERFIQNNIDGTMNLIQSAIEMGVKNFIHISSVAVYGLKPLKNKALMTEKTPLVNFYESAYIEGKVNIENKIQKLETGMNIYIIRPGLLIDDKSRPPAKKMFGRKNKKFLIVGSGKNHLPFIHVKDVVSMICILLGIKGTDKLSSNIYNAVPSQFLSNRKYIKKWAYARSLSYHIISLPGVSLYLINFFSNMLKRILGKKTFPSIVKYQIKSGKRDIRYSNDLARELLGWRDDYTQQLLGYDIE